ncbi:hypothetical protein [Allorhodopirellula solitaria]|uniref:Uncharacterized protein n=1 Tax=Allorhodopirellula solitaria TaxID=2527987 RepID=A0A5C5XN81_9BACT|nr:hypothetical protein [Allorhodopirellula solitaria]TWT64646.1 hypothetical protein CA85_37790 [Allorhodopirellula solitaria]
MLKQLLFTATLLVGGSAPLPSPLASVCSADQPIGSIAAEIAWARAELDPERLPRLPEAEAAVLDAIDECAASLQGRAGAENAAAWMRYLNLGPLTEAIQTGESVGQRGRAAVELESRLRDVHPGLEVEPIVSLRDVVQRYIAALRYSDPKRGLVAVQRQLDVLAEMMSLDSDDDSTSPATADGDDADPGQESRGWSDLSPEEVAQVDLILGGLADANQASELISQVQSHYNHWNIRGWVDGQAVADAIVRPVHTPNVVNDCILGTRMIGQARVDGNVTGQLLPAEGYVRLLIRMDGRFSTTARGYHKPITLDTTGTGRVYAARQLAITEKGVQLGQTVSTAELSTQISRINHPLRIVRRIASQQAAEQRPLAEAISREKLRTQVHSQFDEQTAEMAGRTFPGLDSVVNPWLHRLDFPELIRTIGSRSDSVYAQANLQRKHGLSAPTEPPALDSLWSHDGAGVLPGRYLAAVQVHQSVIDNSISQLLAGQTFTPDRIGQLAETLDLELRNSPDAVGAADDTPDREDYEVDLASFRPVFIEADNQALRLGLRGTRFAQGGREMDRTLQATATYRPVRSEDGEMWLRRDDVVELSFPGNRRLTISQTAIKTNMQESFNELFPKEMLRRTFSIPDTAKVPSLAGRVLRISAIDLSQGWISIAVR